MQEGLGAGGRGQEAKARRPGGRKPGAVGRKIFQVNTLITDVVKEKKNTVE